MNTWTERYHQAAYEAAHLHQAFAAANPRKGTTFELQARRGDVLAEQARVIYLAPGWRWERLDSDGNVLEACERGNSNIRNFLHWYVFGFNYTHVRIGETTYAISALPVRINTPLEADEPMRPSPVIEFSVRMRVDNEPAFWKWALGIWQSQWGVQEPLPESAQSLAGIAMEALVLSNPTWGSELAIEFEDYTSRVVEGEPLPYPAVLTAEEPDE